MLTGAAHLYLPKFTSEAVFRAIGSISAFEWVVLIAVALLIFRRIGNARVSAVTTMVDWLVLLALLLQVATGVYIAFTLRWGSVRREASSPS